MHCSQWSIGVKLFPLMINLISSFILNFRQYRMWALSNSTYLFINDRKESTASELCLRNALTAVIVVTISGRRFRFLYFCFPKGKCFTLHLNAISRPRGNIKILNSSNTSTGRVIKRGGNVHQICKCRGDKLMAPNGSQMAEITGRLSLMENFC